MKKKQTNDEKILAAMDAIDKTVGSMQKYAAKFDSFIDEMAIGGDDEGAKELIKQKIGVNDMIRQLRILKTHIECGAYTAVAMSELGKLPDAIAACKGFLAQSPDFSKLGKGISAIFSDMNKAKEELARLNRVLAAKPAETVASRLDGTYAEEESDRFKAEYAAMIERIKGRIAPEAVSKPNGESVSETGDIDYAGIVSEENNKKD